jgi:hypothetical protein
MTKSMRIRLGVLLALAAALAGCQGPCSKIEKINAPVLNANGVDFSTYVAVGTSLSSGYQSGGLVDRHQIHSFPSLFARQIGKTVSLSGGLGMFTQPTINLDGIPPLLTIKRYSAPVLIDTTEQVRGAATNFTQATAYHNLGIPGSILLDLLFPTHYQAPPTAPVFRTNYVYFDHVLRGQGTVLAQALSLAPTLISLEYGANEVLGPTAQLGIAPSAATGAGYAQLMTGALNTIHGTLPGTRVAVFNVPDVTSIPFFTTFPAATVSATTGLPLPLVGVNGPLLTGDLVLLSAGPLIATGTGIPTGGVNFVYPAAGSNGQPLPENKILRVAEVADTRTEIAKMNAVVDSVATRPFVTRVDMAGFLGGISANGIRVGANVYTSAFIRGGLFSLDGVHPNDLGYALMANLLIDAVNTRFGSSIPRVNVAEFASPNASRARPTGESPYPASLAGLQESLDLLYPRPH